MGELSRALANPAVLSALEFVAIIAGLLILVAVAVGAVERRQDARQAGRPPVFRHAVMGYRRPMPGRLQLRLLVAVLAAALVLVLMRCGGS